MTKMTVTYKIVKTVDAPDNYNPADRPELMRSLLPEPEDFIAELTPEDLAITEVYVHGDDHVHVVY